MAIDLFRHPRTGLSLSRLGFGGAPLGNLNRRLDDAEAVAAVTAAIDAGASLLDTSPLYGQGLSAARIGTALRRTGRDRVVLSTKVGRILEPARGDAGLGGSSPGGGGRARYVDALPFVPRFDYSYDGAMRSLEQSLLLLGTDRVDIVLIHDVDGWTHGAEAVDARFAEAMDGAYRALERLRSEGVIRAIGVGLNEAAMAARFARAGDIDAVLLAGRYSLLEQGALDDFLPLADDKGIAVLMGGVFNSGVLATGPVEGALYNYRPAPPDILERVGRIEAVCRRHGTPLAVAAARFPLGHPAVASVVLGMVTPAEVARNVAAFDTAVPAALWSELVAEGLLRPDAPIPG
jgi:D-threo-aldose 1-dehydrogenase